MKVRTLIGWIYRHFGRASFRSSHVLRDQYSPYPITRNAIYSAVHKCWKMRLLSRTKMIGNCYIYRITDWGVRYVEEGDYYREDDIRIMLLCYIVDSDKKMDKEWAEDILVPRLLQRFLPGRKAQDIRPFINLLEVIENVTLPLENKIKAETIEQDEQFIIQYLQDVQIILLAYLLMRQLYPTATSSLDYKSMKRQIRKILNESIDELSNPPKETILHTYLGYEASIGFKPYIEDRPNTKDLARLEKVIKTLKKLKEHPRIANEVK